MSPADALALTRDRHIRTHTHRMLGTAPVVAHVERIAALLPDLLDAYTPTQEQRERIRSRTMATIRTRDITPPTEQDRAAA